MENCRAYPTPYDRETYLAITIVLFITFVGLWGSNWFILTRKPEDTTRESTLSGSGLVINDQKESALVINETKKE